MSKDLNKYLCIECDADTRWDGFVNRIPADNGVRDGGLCGGCVAIWDAELEKDYEELEENEQ